MDAAQKKIFYNRVRRICTLHDIEIRYQGAPKNWRSVELVKDGDVLCSDSATDFRPLDIDWERLLNEIKEVGFVGGNPGRPKKPKPIEEVA